MAAQVLDWTHLLDKEQGSSFDQDTILFANYDDGGVFQYNDQFFVRDIKDMLEVDSKSQTLESVLSLPIRQAPFTIQQGRSKTKVYDRVNEIMTSPANLGGMETPLNLVVAQMCNAFVYKKAYFEKVWGERFGGVGYEKLAWRPPGTCAVERDPNTGAFLGFRQMPISFDDTDEKKFSPQRSFVYIHGSHRDPLEGVSDLTITQWCYKTKQKIRFLWYQFLEGQALPKTIVKAADVTEATEAAKKIIGLKNGGVVGVSDRISAEPLESSGRGAAEFRAAIQWLDTEASSSVLAGFTDLGAAAAGGTGSFALSKDQTDFFLMSRQATSREMGDFINQFVIADLVKWNFGPDEVPPYFQFGPIAQEDMNSSISLLQATAQTPVNQSVLPQEFFDELTLRVSGFLDLDVKTVKEGLDRAAKEAAKAAMMNPSTATPQGVEVAQVAGRVNAATNALQQRTLAAVE